MEMQMQQKNVVAVLAFIAVMQYLTTNCMLCDTIKQTECMKNYAMCVNSTCYRFCVNSTTNYTFCVKAAQRFKQYVYTWTLIKLFAINHTFLCKIGNEFMQNV